MHGRCLNAVLFWLVYWVLPLLPQMFELSAPASHLTGGLEGPPRGSPPPLGVQSVLLGGDLLGGSVSSTAHVSFLV